MVDYRHAGVVKSFEDAGLSQEQSRAIATAIPDTERIIAAIGDLRGEMVGEFGKVRGEIKDLRSEINRVHTRIDGVDKGFKLLQFFMIPIYTLVIAATLVPLMEALTAYFQ